MLQENHLLYENDYFIIPMLHFLSIKQDVQKILWWPLFLLPLF